MQPPTAQAPSVSAYRRGTPPLERMVFARQEAIAPAAIEQALDALWREASEQLLGDKPGGGLLRAALWNLVAYHPSRTGAFLPSGAAPATDDGAQLRALLGHLSTLVPARAIYLDHHAEEPAPGPEGGTPPDIEAHVATDCLMAGDTPRMVCLQAVHLAGRGQAGLAHFPALVRALLMPDLPVALLWLEDVPRRGLLLAQLLRLCDKLIFDNQHTQAPDTLLAVHEVVRNAQATVVDLSWMRLAPLRHLVAGFFDAPGRLQCLEALESVHLRTSPRGRNAGLLLLGWLLSRCGYRPTASTLASALGADSSSAWRAEGPGGPLSVALEVFGEPAGTRGDSAGPQGEPAAPQSADSQNGGADGIISLEIRAGGQYFALRDKDPWHMAMEGPDGVVPSLPLPVREDADLVARALASGGNDPVFQEALAAAVQLAELEQWNQ